MTAQTQVTEENSPAPLPAYHSILLAVDSSDHSNRATTEAIKLAEIWNAKVIGAHVYAAKLHDLRFRQMEGGLPEQFQEEQELERQRDVHDDLITRGLSIITDSYLDQAEANSEKAGIEFTRRALEGKNYRALTEETNSGDYDLLVMGSLGLGAIKGSRLGTVCSRVARRSNIDTLVIKQPKKDITEGPIVVAVDGSTRGYGGLLTGLALAQEWNAPLHVISAFDPYYHYVAFNRIAGVLSEEAGKVFKFKEQEKLHEEIIDSGLAKIYQGHLEVAQSIADDYGIEITSELLDGKPHDAIEKYLHKVDASLLVLGKLGIHADTDLDIGGNADHLLHNSDCAVLLSNREHQPQVDLLASVTTSWTNEAEARMERVPSFVRSMARMAILRYAQEKGHTVITESIVEEATAQLMPNHAEDAMAEIVEAYDAGEIGNKKSGKPSLNEVMRWSEEATKLLRTVDDLSVRGNISMRAEKKARQEDSNQVEKEHIAAFLDSEELASENLDSEMIVTESAEPASQAELYWDAAALARLMRVPEGFMRDASRERIENYARQQGISEVTLKVAGEGLALAREAMESSMKGEQAETGNAPKTKGVCPFAHDSDSASAETDEATPDWSAEADAIVQKLPEGMSRDMTRKAVSAIAAQNGLKEISAEFVEQILTTFRAGSVSVTETLPWDEDARNGISRAPDMVRGMLVKEVEGWAARNNMQQVSQEAVDAVKEEWAKRGIFHLDPDDPRNDL